jgi:hypothetical protein
MLPVELHNDFPHGCFQLHERRFIRCHHNPAAKEINKKKESRQMNSEFQKE